MTEQKAPDTIGSVSPVMPIAAALLGGIATCGAYLPVAHLFHFFASWLYYPATVFTEKLAWLGLVMGCALILPLGLAMGVFLPSIGLAIFARCAKRRTIYWLVGGLLGGLIGAIFSNILILLLDLVWEYLFVTH